MARQNSCRYGCTNVIHTEFSMLAYVIENHVDKIFFTGTFYLFYFLNCFTKMLRMFVCLFVVSTQICRRLEKKNH